jgi:2-haloacid dehalogenase
MSPGTVSPLSNVKALTFDVFGTVVDWRASVIEELVLRAHRKKTATDLPEAVSSRLQILGEEDWARFAQEWRNTYKQFCHFFDPAVDKWKTVDQHHRDSLVELLAKWDLTGLYSETEIDSLSLVWHRLKPWDDSLAGLQALGKQFVTSTLSNGNVNLLRDLDDFGGLGFRQILSAENFNAYKPHPSVYRGAASKLGLSIEEVAMVAAHLADLKAARACGMRTVFVERPQEELWKPESDDYKEAKNWVDIWVSMEDGGGFETVAKKLAEFA